ncbi:pseudouridine synthase [soil metagenome]
MRAGRVVIDGERATLGQRVTPGADLRVDGKPVHVDAEQRTFMLHKPRGVVTTANDERGRGSVLALLPDVPGLHTIGRLDRDSEGLLLATTDGELTLRLTHPRYGHTKTYRVWCERGTPVPEALAALRRGVALDDGPARALAARPAEDGVVIVLGEGRSHQVRRMLEVVGHRVTRLVRTHVGGLPLAGLEPGAWRELGPKDFERLGYVPQGPKPARAPRRER